MDKTTAADLLGMAENEITGVHDTADGTLIDTFDGNTMIVVDGPLAGVTGEEASRTARNLDGRTVHVLLYRPPTSKYNDYPVFAGFSRPAAAGPDENLNAAEVQATAAALVDDPGPGGPTFSGSGPAETQEPKRLSEANADTGARNVAAAGDPADPGTVVPDGAAHEVLAWVGEDPARAQQALDFERSRPDPRSTLVKKLETLVDEPSRVTEGD